MRRRAPIYPAEVDRSKSPKSNEVGKGAFFADVCDTITTIVKCNDILLTSYEIAGHKSGSKFCLYI